MTNDRMDTGEAWIVTHRRCDAAALAQHRSVFAVSNGRLGLSGHIIGDRDGPWPLTLVAGIYDELDMFSQIRASARTRPWLDEACFDGAGASPAVAALPDPLLVRVFVDGREISLALGRITQLEQTLLLQCGVYAYVFDYRDADGRATQVECQRFASLNQPERVYMRVAITPLDHDAPIRILSGVDGAVRSNLTGQRQFEIVDRAADASGVCRMTVRTRARGHVLRMTVEHRLRSGPAPLRTSGLTAADSACTEFEFAGAAGRTIVFERCVTVAGESPNESSGAAAARSHTSAGRQGAELNYAEAMDVNHEAWRSLWARADVEIEGDPEAQRNLRFCLFHLLSAAPRWSEAASVPVKLLTGQYYQGNTFYDTDLYIMPFYTFACPELARPCIGYRIAGMEHGRKIAARQGFRGLKLAWQAGPFGEECLGDWYWFPRTNIHINADAAYALMQFVRATGNAELLRGSGLELLVDAARFYASRATRISASGASEGGQTWDFADVSGPDEGHCHSRSNFYTNFLAARTLEWAAEAWQALDGFQRSALDRRLGLEPDEPATWLRIARGLRLLFDSSTGVCEQCEGFFRLKPLPEDFLARRSAWFEPVYEYQAMNQPDVLMAMMLFGQRFDARILRANWEAYRGRSLDFSSMSYVVHAIIAARLGEADEAYRNFRISAGMDLDESLTGRHDTHQGLHGTAMGGAWMAAVFGLAGVQFPVKGPLQPVDIQINPCLPPHWLRLRFKLMLLGEQLEIVVTQHEVRVHVGTRAALHLPARIGTEDLTLVSGKTARVAIAPRADRADRQTAPPR